MHRAAPVVLAAALGACANHPVPRDMALEARFRPATPAAQLPAQFQVVTFNVHMESGDEVAAAIAGDRSIRDADVIVMEEVHRSLPAGATSQTSCSGACAIGRLLDYHVVYAAGHGAGDGDDGVAVLSKAPITSAQVLVLPYFDVHANSGRRVALAATITHAGRPITVYAVHLDNRLTVRDRRTQLTPVLEHARRQPRR